MSLELATNKLLEFGTLTGETNHNWQMVIDDNYNTCGNPGRKIIKVGKNFKKYKQIFIGKI